MADRDVLPRTPRTPRLSSRLVALPEPDASPSAGDSALSLTQYRCKPLDLDQLTSILSVEEQRIQNELLESEELFLHDVHGISAGGPGTDVLRCVHLLNLILILIAFITGNSSLEPLIEGLCAQIHVNLR